VSHVLKILNDELSHVMALAGTPTINDISRAHVATVDSYYQRLLATDIPTRHHQLQQYRSRL
jgi:hypothetical protein